MKMERPGTDINDPKILSGAKRVATRKNNDFRRMVEKKLSLFSDELFADYETVTPEKVIERRIILQDGADEASRERKISERKTIREFKAECKTLCSNDAELLRILRRRIGFFGGRHKFQRWYGILNNLRRRLKPLSELADMVYAWSKQEEKPFTHWDLWRRRGDGHAWEEISNALHELSDRELIEITGSLPSVTDRNSELNAMAYIHPKFLKEKNTK